MPLLTLFSAPKPFTDPLIATIQRNAIQSWLHLSSDIEVFLVGQEEGLAETAQMFGVRLLPDVVRNQSGTPLVSSIIQLARQESTSSTFVYVNGDVILLPDLLTATRMVKSQFESFLIIGQRWDLEIRQDLGFKAGWEIQLKEDLARRGRLHPPAGSDYFVFPSSMYLDVPDFAIGRAGWDNWMIYHARQQNIPVVDATRSITVIHQDHDYYHLPGNKPHHDHFESDQNQTLAGGMSSLYYVLDSTHELVDGNIRQPRLSLLRLLRRIELFLMPEESVRHGWRWTLARQFRRARRFRM